LHSAFYQVLRKNNNGHPYNNTSVNPVHNAPIELSPARSFFAHSLPPARFFFARGSLVLALSCKPPPTPAVLPLLAPHGTGSDWIEKLTNRQKLRKKDKKEDEQRITTTFTTIIQKGYSFVHSFIHQR
jgi:hypothetical protein